MQELERLQKLIDSSDNIVFFGGAGVSTESGIPDFRSVDGLYHTKYDYPPETILSHSFFCQRPEAFYRFYREKMLCLDAKPNTAHLKLAELERAGKLRAVITQNIDGLHQEAGSREVLELHGSIHRNYCVKCHALYDAQYMKSSDGVPKCTCGGMIKPDVVLYEEGLNSEILRKSVEYITKTDLLIVGGTSLVVYPAASLIDYYQGSKLVVINKGGAAGKRADLVLDGAIGEILGKIKI